MRVNAIWIGDALSTVEQLCLASWIHHGHQVVLWTEKGWRPKKTPVEVECCDCHDFMKGPILRYQDRKHLNSPVLHANMFRFKWMLLGCEPFIDCDTMCLTDAPLPGEPFSSEQCAGDQLYPNFAYVWVRKPQTPLAEWLWNEAKRLAIENPVWGPFGPRLLRKGIETVAPQTAIMKPEAFCAIGWGGWKTVFDGSGRVPAYAHGQHLWANIIRKNNFDVDSECPKDSVWETWKRKYL